MVLARTIHFEQCSQERISTIESNICAMDVQLFEPDIVFRSLAFTGFTGAWLVRMADPTKTYPAQQITYAHQYRRCSD